MSTIGNGYLDSLIWPDKDKTPPAENSNQQLSQEDFFKLMTQQLAYQDPSKPMDNDQMISQMSSFATIESMSEMTSQMATLTASVQSSQALNASLLVGKKVLVPNDTGFLPAGGDMTGTVVAGANSGPVTVRIEDENGQLIKTIPMQRAEGNVPFRWDGTDNNGNPVPEGKYVVKASSTVDGQTTELNTAVHAHVESVTVNAGQVGAILNLKGNGSVLLKDVLEVAEGGSSNGSGETSPEQEQQNYAYRGF